jgi:predicted GIY-YIG superfamily endonuclease
MASVYILYSPCAQKYYTGYTKDFQQRLGYHLAKEFANSYTAKYAHIFGFATLILAKQGGRIAEESIANKKLPTGQSQVGRINKIEAGQNNYAVLVFVAAFLRSFLRLPPAISYSLL